MKYIIYTLYAVTVLLFSGFARANTLANVSPTEAKSPFTIIEILANPQTLDLEVNGYLPNPCYSVPSAVMVQDRENTNVLVLHVVSMSPPPGFCIAKLQDYSRTFNLRQLAQASGLPIDTQGLYVVKTEGYDFAVEISGQELMNVPN